MKILKNKKIVVISLAILFFFTFLISLHFYRVEEKRKEIDKEPVVLPEDDSFQNDSSLSIEEINNLIESKLTNLRELFYESKVYELREIDSSKSLEENEEYIVFDSIFLNKFSSLVIDELYYKYFQTMTLLKEEPGKKFYMAKKNIFENIYLDSVIASNSNCDDFRLIIANDKKIQASVTLSFLDSEMMFYYPFSLDFVNEEWKVSIF